MGVMRTAPYDSAMDATISLVSAVVAIFGACLAFWSNHDERRRRQREQASQVSGWVAPQAGAAEWQARIRNRSTLPVYNVRTVFHEMEKLPDAPNAGFGWRSVDLGVPASRESTICVLPPETDGDVPVHEEFKWLYSSPTDRTCVVSISFTDAARHHWEGDEHGVLRRATESREVRTA
jgi:hypothetical protein